MAVSEQTNVLRDEHNDFNQYLTSMRTDIHAMQSSLTTMAEVAHHRKEQHPNTRRKLQDKESENNILSPYEFIKFTAALEILDKTKGEMIFLLIPLGSDYTTTVLFALDQILGISTLNVQVEFVNRRILIHRNEQLIITFLDRASGRMHDAFLTKFINAFFATLPDSNPLSLRSRKSQSEQASFPLHIDQTKPYY